MSRDVVPTRSTKPFAMRVRGTATIRLNDGCKTDQAHRFLPKANTHSPACCFALFGSSRPDSSAVAGVGSKANYMPPPLPSFWRCAISTGLQRSADGFAWKSRVVCPYPTKRDVRWQAAAMKENVPCGADIPNRRKL
jgi:hypothetical protein